VTDTDDLDVAGSSGPLVSIVIPTYNRGPLVLQTVASALSQDYDAIEVIVVDDGSTDGTAQRLREECPGIRVLEIENSERGAARNRGAEQARGSFIAFLDSDDLLEPWHVSQFVDAWQTSCREPGIYVCPPSTWDPDSGVVRVDAKFSRLARGELLPSALRGTLWPPDCAILPRSSFLAIGGFPEDRAMAGSEDWAFLVRILATEIPVRFLPRAAVRLREHPGRSMGDDVAIAASRRAALDFLVEDGLAGRPLEASEQRIATAGTYRFCAAHAYRAGNGKEARSYLRQLPRLVGVLASVRWAGRLWLQTWLSRRIVTRFRALL
jgi:glycosyltransferase involved in cell wall biosynthesis